MAGRGLWPNNAVLALALALVLLAACSGPAREPREATKVPNEPSAALSRAAPTPPPSASSNTSPSTLPSPPPAPAKLARFPPRDECAKLPGFAAFREALFSAIRKRDTDSLAALADPAVTLDFDSGKGPDELRKRLVDNPGLWKELAALDELGCAVDGGVAALPWIFSRFPDAVDPFRAVLVMGEDVPLRAKASADARVLARLDWPVLETVAPSFDPGRVYTEVTGAGASGFVETAKLRGVIDYRLIADREGDAWKITAFIAGD